MKSKRLLSMTFLAVLSCFSSGAALAQQAGESDRIEDGSFSVPGWFSKDKSDIARYPVPLSSPSSQSSQSPAQGPVVVFDKFGGFTNKTIYTPTPFGLRPKQDFSALAANPWAAPGAAPFAYGGYPGYGGVGGYGYGGYGGLAGLGMSAIPGWGGIPAIAGIGGFGIPSIPGLPGLGLRIPGLGAMRSFSSFYGSYGNPYIQSSGFSGFGVNRISRTIMVRPDPKPVGGYYAPPTGNTGSGYYASGTPAIPMPQAVMPKQSPRDYWGDNGNPFGKDMNKTPW